MQERKSFEDMTLDSINCIWKTLPAYVSILASQSCELRPHNLTIFVFF
jgi:hypothetical protein